MFFEYTDKLWQQFNFHSIYLRRACRTAIAMFVSVIVYRYYSLTQGFWVPLTVIIVMQATTAATLRKGLQRLLGTLLGIIIGSLLVLYIHNRVLLDFLLIFFLFFAYYLKAFNIINYGIFVIPLTIMVVFLVSVLVPAESKTLIPARLYDTGIGTLIGILATLFIFPNSLKSDVMGGIKHIMQVQYMYFHALCQHFLNNGSIQYNIEKLRDRFEHCLSENRSFFYDWCYELWFRLKKHYEYERFLQLTEQLERFLLALHNLVQYQSVKLNKNIIQSLEKIAILINKNNIDVDIDFNELSKQIDVIKQPSHKEEDDFFVITLASNLEGYKNCILELNLLKKKLV